MGFSDRKYHILYPIFLGILFFEVVFGFSLLDPQNIGWLTEGDASQHYSGWNFFRNEPWSIPLGKYYYDPMIESSIVFTDSNPLLSILFKIFRGFLPEVFQFFGMWLLFCVVMQSIMLWKTLSLYIDNLIILILGVALLLLNPAWMVRLGHINLMGFFLITSAIYLSLKAAINNRYKNIYWVLLFFVSLGTHFYLFMIVGLCWIFTLTHIIIFNQKNYRKFSIFLVFNIFIVSLILWFYGYLIAFNFDTEGIRGPWGFYKANFFTFFIPAGHSSIYNISNYFPGEYEGYGYLGAGVILLCLLSIVTTWKKIFQFKWVTKYLGVFLFTIASFLIALSPNVGFGPYNLTVPFPDKLTEMTGYIRASGRFIWPVMIVVGISVIVNIYSIRIKNKGVYFVYFIMFTAVFLQIMDLSRSWLIRRDVLSSSSSIGYSNPYNDLWEKGLKNYESIRLIPATNSAPKTFELQLLAAKYNQNINAIYLTHWDVANFLKLNNEVRDAVVSGNYELDTVYVFTFDIGNMFISNNKVKYFQYKDLYVLAPEIPIGCRECNELANKLKPIKKIDVSSNPDFLKLTLGKGWSGIESWGVWSDGTAASLWVPNSDEIQIVLNAFVTENNPLDTVWFCDSHELAEIKFIKSEDNIVRLDLSNCDVNNVDVMIINPRSPSSMGMGSDDRMLGIGFKELKTLD